MRTNHRMISMVLLFSGIFTGIIGLSQTARADDPFPPVFEYCCVPPYLLNAGEMTARCTKACGTVTSCNGSSPFPSWLMARCTEWPELTCTLVDRTPAMNPDYTCAENPCGLGGVWVECAGVAAFGFSLYSIRDCQDWTCP